MNYHHFHGRHYYDAEPLAANDDDDSDCMISEKVQPKTNDNSIQQSHSKPTFFDTLVDQVLDDENDWTMEYNKDDIFEKECQEELVLDNNTLATKHSEPYNDSTDEMILEEQPLTAIQAQARKGVLDAIGMLPQEKREAYDFAVKSNPFVVEIETPIERFSLVNNYNYWDTAAQLCDFWTLRKKFLGEERYWLPVRISPESQDESALAPKAIEAIHSGTMAVLPPNAKNQPVLLWDRQLQTEVTRDDDILAQISYYVIHVLCEMDLALSNGYVLFVLPDYVTKVAPGAPPPPSRMFATKATELLWDPSIPVKNQAVHYLHIHHVKFATKRINNFISWLRQNFSNRLHAWNFVRSKMHIHSVAGMEEAHTVLKKFEMSPSLHMPRRLPFGGTHDAHWWLQCRVEQEAKLYSDDTMAACGMDDDNSNPAADLSDLDWSMRSFTSASPGFATHHTLLSRDLQQLYDTTVNAGEADIGMISSTNVFDSPQEQAHTRKTHDTATVEEDNKKGLLEVLISQNRAFLDTQEKRNRSLLQEHELLKAQLVRAEFVTLQYEQDYQSIHDYLERIFMMVDKLPSDENEAAKKSKEIPIPSMVKDVLDYVLIFKGRNPVVGQSLMLNQQYENASTLGDQRVQNAMQDLTELLQILTKGTLNNEDGQHFEDCQSETQRPDMMSILESSSVDYDMEKEMDDMISLLQTKVSSLHQINQKLQKEQEFLEASRLCAHHLAAEFEEYKRQNLTSFARSVATAVAVLLYQKRRDGVDTMVTDPSSPYWQVMADRVLSKLLWWRAQPTPSKITLEMLSLAMPT